MRNPSGAKRFCWLRDNNSKFCRRTSSICFRPPCLFFGLFFFSMVKGPGIEAVLELQVFRAKCGRCKKDYAIEKKKMKYFKTSFCIFPLQVYKLPGILVISVCVTSSPSSAFSVVPDKRSNIFIRHL